MARDVEFNVTASDRTGNALNAAARRVAATQKKMTDDAEKSFGGLGKHLISVAELAGPRVGQAVTRGLASASEMIGPLLGSGVIAAAPLIGATLSAAVIGGAGIGGVLGGVMLAARDPRVAAAGKTLGADLLASLTDSARPFIVPVLQSIDQIRAGFDRVSGNVQRIFANSSKFVGPLTDGVLAFTESLIRGFDTLVSRAGPVIASIRGGLTQFGSALETMFDQIATGADGAATAIDTIFDTLSGAALTLGPIITGLTDIYNLSNKIAPGLLPVIARIQEMSDTTGTLSGHTAAAAGAWDAANGPAANYAATLEALAATQRTLIGDNVSLMEATTEAAQAFRTAREAVAAHGRGLDLNTKQGLANSETLAGLARKLNAQYDAYIKVHGAGEGANEILRSNRSNFLQVANAATGSAAAARRLADDLIGIPDRKPKVELLDRASGKVNTVINRLAALRDKTVNVTVRVHQSGDAAALRKQDQTSTFSATGYTSSIAAGAGQYRTGGPTAVNLSSTVNVALDGAPVRAITTQAIDDNERRRNWRERVGAR
jgi:hypothetical protein